VITVQTSTADPPWAAGGEVCVDAPEDDVPDDAVVGVVVELPQPAIMRADTARAPLHPRM
jgi:hypothetical protein